MNKNELIKELFSYPEKSFSRHLELRDNHRILFSGRFGTGKTTFIDYFFEDSEKARDYNAVHIFPVNYQIARNEDIIEHIKYDIIAHLLSVKEIKFEKSDLPTYKVIPLLMSKRPADIVAPLLHFFGGTGKVYDSYKELMDEISTEYEQLETNEEETLRKYLKNSKEIKGSIYENDFYTGLIAKLLLKWKQENDAENVLVIDDLDRIDPAHAFRLFNIFSAHFDHREKQPNKFGFDKVIFVCDLHNIRNIFAYNYGENTDFSGYIDKFYSKQVYRFDNTESIKELSKKAAQRLLFRENTDFHDGQTKKDDNLCIALSFVLKMMVLSDAINLRQLLKIHTSNLITLPQQRIPLDENTTVFNTQLTIVRLLEVLVQIVGNAQDLKIAFTKCEQYESTYQSTSISKSAVVSSLAALIGYKKGRSGESQKIKISETLKVNYKLEYHNSSSINATLDYNQDDLSGVNIFSIYIQGLEYLFNLGFFPR